MNRGRGRGINNAPAWMNQQQQQQQQQDLPGGPPPPPPNRGGYDRRSPPSHHHNNNNHQNHHHHHHHHHHPRGGGGYHHRGGRDNYPRHDGFHQHRRGPGNGRRNGGGGGSQFLPGMPQFTSLEHERSWVDDRRRKRQQRLPGKFDVLPENATSTTSTTTTAGVADPAVLATANAAAAALAATLLPGGAATMNAVPTQTRHARRLYIGNLPHPVNEPMIHECFLNAIRTAWVGPAPLGNEDPILSVYINHERRFAFLEFKQVPMASACMNLDGLMLNGVALKIKRPNDYNEWTAQQALMGQPIPELDVSRLGIISGNVLDGPNKIFIGGLHYHLTEHQVLELLQAFGKIKAFHLVKSGDEAIGTNNLSKGYCFVEYADPTVTATAIQGLNGMDIGGGKSLTARLAGERPGAMPMGTTEAAPSTTAAAMPPGATDTPAAAAAPVAPGAPPADRNIVQGYDIEALVDAAMGKCPMPTAPTYTDALGMPLTRIVQLFAPALPAAVLGGSPPATAPPAVALPPLPAAGGALVPPTSVPPPSAMAALAQSRVLVLHNMVQPEDLATDQDHKALTDEVRDECAKYGRILSIKIPRQASPTIQASAVGKIYLEYASIPEAIQAQEALRGRQFGDAVVNVAFCDEGNYAAGKLE